MNGYTETVSLAGLFTTQAAVAEVCESTKRAEDFADRLRVREAVSEVVNATGWKTEEIDGSLRSAILLAQSERNTVRQMEPALLRSAFRERGVGLSAYDTGRVRLSIPSDLLKSEEQLKVSNAFEQIAAI